MIVVDVETTGLDPIQGSILSIGALDFDDPAGTFYEECRAWDGARIEPEALAVNGFSQEDATSTAKQTEAQLISAFCSWAGERVDMTLAAQNVTFDSSFLEAACARAGIPFPFGKRSVDVHSVVWMHLRQQGSEVPLRSNRSAISLDWALSYCGLPPEPKPHNALTGAYAHAEVIARVTYNKNIIAEYSSFPIPWTPLEVHRA